MPRLRSQMGLSGTLPPELVERCLEFLPFEDLHTNVKQLSKAMRSAARRCLTCGRWRPIRYVVEEAIVANALHGSLATAASAQFRAAWALDPGLVLLELILLWRNEKDSHEDDDRGMTPDVFYDWDRSHFQPSVARFLAHVEPSIDGLGRFTMALERLEIHFRGRSRFRGEMSVSLLSLWTKRLGDSTLIDDSGREMNMNELLNPESLVGSGLESWAEPKDVAKFLHWLRYWSYDADYQSLLTAARALSRNWQNRRKADAFVAIVDADIRLFNSMDY